MTTDKEFNYEGIVETPDDRIWRESDVPSMSLPGTVAGAASQSQSDDEPGWDLVTGSNAPVGVIPSEAERKLRASSSMQRYELDYNYRGVIDSFIYFTIGKGIRTAAQDESQEVKDYLNEFIKMNHMDGRDRDVVSKVLKTGECFVRFFTKNGGKKARIPAVRILNYWEISDIEVDENDSEKILKYKRPFKVKDAEPKTEEIDASDIVHVKHSDLDEKRGRPPFVSIMQSCQYYMDWLFNRVVLNRIKTSYYLEEILDGSPAQVTSADASHPEGFRTGEAGKKILRMPKPGSKLTHNKAITYKWLTPDVGAVDAKEDGRAIRLSIAAGAQVPEFVLGDSSNTNFATALVSQNPFVRKVEWFQDFFEAYFKQIFSWVISYGIANNFIPKISTETIMKEKAENVGMFRKLMAHFKVEEQVDDSGNVIVIKKIPTKTEVDIQWPNLIAQDILKDTKAYQLHQAMGVASSETLSHKLGYDFGEEQRKIKTESQREGDDDEGFGGKDRDEEINKKDDDDEEDEND